MPLPMSMCLLRTTLFLLQLTPLPRSSSIIQPRPQPRPATSFRHLIPVPVKLKAPQSSRKRKDGHDCVISASPHKRMLVEMKERKNEKLKRTEERKERKSKVSEQKVTESKCDSRKPKRITKGVKKGKGRLKKGASLDSDSDCPCLYCGQLYSQSSEDFVECQGDCGNWAHIGCANITVQGHFVCKICEDKYC